MSQRWKVVGINFDHFHMEDLLRFAHAHDRVDIVGVCDERPERVQSACRKFGLSPQQVFTDIDVCLKATEADLAILCPNTADHAHWTERVAQWPVHILMEKPFASSLADADRMIRAMTLHGRQLAINWPLRWYPSHATAYRLVEQGAIGEVWEVHYYDGNRGPLWHGADKVEKTPTREDKQSSWFYRRDCGGGSLLDYLGYGSTLATWYHGGRAPREICCMVDATPGLEVDEQSVTVARYDVGLSTFQTRWGTLSDPWTHQPLPRCGFVIRGSEGAISSYDFEPSIHLIHRNAPEGRSIPVDQPAPEVANPINYVINCLEQSLPIEGPLSPMMSRIGQQIVDTAMASAQAKQTLPLLS